MQSAKGSEAGTPGGRGGRAGRKMGGEGYDALLACAVLYNGTMVQWYNLQQVRGDLAAGTYPDMRVSLLPRQEHGGAARRSAGASWDEVWLLATTGVTLWLWRARQVPGMSSRGFQGKKKKKALPCHPSSNAKGGGINLCACSERCRRLPGEISAATSHTDLCPKRHQSRPPSEESSP